MLNYTVNTTQTMGCDSLITVTVSDACGNTDAVTYLVMIGCAVTNTNDSGIGSLRDVIGCAQDGANITFDPGLSGQTILLTTGEILINKNLTLSGLGMQDLTISGNNASRIFHLFPGHTFIIKDMALKDAETNPNGGAIFVKGNLMLQNVMLQHNFENGNPKSMTLSNTAIFEVNGNLEIRY
jgi:hypothetical protein